MNAHEIDFKIYGDDMQFVEIELDPQETVMAEPGAMMMMDQSIEMNTIFGDGSQQESGLLGKLFSAGKRVLTGENLFMTAFTNTGTGKKHVSFSAPYPGKIIPVDLLNYNGNIICQIDAFLCAAKGVSIGIEFTKKLGAGFFGGEGFILQKLRGDGMVFVHAGGTVVEKRLVNDKILIDTGCIVAFESQIDYSIERAGNLKSMIFGGEGLFLAFQYPTEIPGVANVYEVTTHLRGEAGDRQIEGAKVGLTHVIGLGSACGIHILEKAA